MPSLASIPETPSIRYTSAKRPSTHSVASFERARPRSRVVVLSRHSSRVRKRFYQSLASAEHSYPPQSGRAADGATESLGQSPYKVHGPSPKPACVVDDAASDMSKTSGHVFEPSEVSLDLDAFPLPPSNTNAWPLSDNARLSNSSHQKSVTRSARPQRYVPTERIPKSSTEPSSSTPISNDLAVTRPARNLDDGDSSRSRKRDSIDPFLVEAITKSVAEQLCLYPSVNGHESPTKSTQPSSDIYREPSRTASQRQALQRYTEELQRYAQNVGATGKVPVFTPTPSKSSATLRTVSALLPYRPEFQAAGLAVTSQDQTPRSARARIHASAPRNSRKKTRPPTASRLGGMDGKEDTVSRPSTEVDFMDPNNVDIWRRALVEHVPAPGHAQPRRNNTSSTTRCLPCFSPKQANPTINQFAVKTSIADMQIRESGKGIESPVPGPWPTRTKGLRPKGCTIPQTVRNRVPGFDRRHQGRVATYDEPAAPVKTLRRRSKTLAQLHSLAQLAQERRKPPPQSAPRLGEVHGRKTHCQSTKGQTLLDSLPQHSSKLDLHRFAQRQYQSLPVNRLDPSLAGLVPATECSPTLDTRATSLPNNGESSRRAAKNGSKNTKNKATMAALEIARHDCGPYPAREPKPRPDSRRTSGAPPIPSRKSSIRRLKSNRDADADFSSIMDCDVLQGLRIVTTAACDKRIDGLFHEKTGIHIRRFLAELFQFDSVGMTRPGETARERAGRRQSQMRELKRIVRRSREMRRAMPE